MSDDVIGHNDAPLGAAFTDPASPEMAGHSPSAPGATAESKLPEPAPRESKLPDLAKPEEAREAEAKPEEARPSSRPAPIPAMPTQAALLAALDPPFTPFKPAVKPTAAASASPSSTASTSSAAAAGDGTRAAVAGVHGRDPGSPVRTEPPTARHEDPSPGERTAAPSLPRSQPFPRPSSAPKDASQAKTLPATAASGAGRTLFSSRPPGNTPARGGSGSTPASTKAPGSTTASAPRGPDTTGSERLTPGPKASPQGESRVAAAAQSLKNSAGRPAIRPRSSGAGKPTASSAAPSNPVKPASSARGVSAPTSAPKTVTVDLGNQPPLSVDGSEADAIDRRRISVQWFSGTILTGLCGAALMGGAVFGALDGETTFAATPERIETVTRTAERSGTPRKTDRLPQPSDTPNAARQIIRVSTAARAGQREIMRVRPFMRIASNLALSATDLSAKIPAFNAQRLLAASENNRSDENEAADSDPDAEISFVTRDLTAVLPRAKVVAALSQEDILMRVREASPWRGSSGIRYAVASAGTTGTTGSDVKLAYAAEGNPSDPYYAGFEARIVPENVTMLPKTREQATTGAAAERIHIAKKGDSVVAILREQGATVEEAYSIATAFGGRGRDGGLKEGQKLRIMMAPIAGTRRQQPVRVIIANDSAAEAVVALSDLGKYVAIDPQSLNTPSEATTATAQNEDDDEESGIRLYQSIYETALRNKVPNTVIENLIRIYSYDVDFQRKVEAGDSFEVFFAGEEEGAVADSKNSEVLFASLTVGGETKKYYRYQSPDDGVVDYYDETGKSAKKFLVRKPLAAGTMRSGFGGRRHPILGYYKMHTGVDWAAPHGTPIFASGNGVIDKVGWEGGYGKYIRIRHPNGYETAYGHMTAYAKGMEAGKTVRQGQVIGFVGSTGLSTGAHVHYEILVNGRFVDPMRIRLPRGRSLEGAVLASFEHERDRLDNLMATRGGKARVAGGQGTAR